MSCVQLTDPSLQAWICGPQAARDLTWLAPRLATLLGRACTDSAPWVLYFAARHPGRPDPREILEALYRVCPRNLAERVHEGLNLYWCIGARALPPLLDLAAPLVQAELHLYTHLRAGGAPYRDHLVHMTRVASLAHWFLSQPEALGLPPALQWNVLRHHWAYTHEFHLLRQYAARRGLALLDPSGESVHCPDPWQPMVATAALLAGLLHDLGYIHKALGEVAEPAVAAVPWVLFSPQVNLSFDPSVTPIQGFYEAALDVTLHGQAYAPLPEFLHRHYREIHSLVGALWLAGLPLANPESDVGGQCPESDSVARRSEAELVLQLAAMMAFGHDLALSGETRRKRLLLRQVSGRGGKPRDVLNLEDYPLCTLFALADVLQEFGRTVQVVEKNSLQHVVPIAGISLRSDETQTPALRIRYLTREKRESGFLLPKTALRRRELGTWTEEKVGAGVEAWLNSAGLSDFVSIDSASRCDKYDPGIGVPDLVVGALP